MSTIILCISWFVQSVGVGFVAELTAAFGFIKIQSNELHSFSVLHIIILI